MIFGFFWTIKEKLKKRKMDTSQEIGRWEMLMDVGKSTVQLSHVTNCITIYKHWEDTFLQTKMMRDLPVTFPMKLNSYFFTKAR